MCQKLIHLFCMYTVFINFMYSVFKLQLAFQQYLLCGWLKFCVTVPKQCLFFRTLPPVVCLFLNLQISMKKSKLSLLFSLIHCYWLVTSRFPILLGDWRKAAVAALKELPAWWRKRNKDRVFQFKLWFECTFEQLTWFLANWDLSPQNCTYLLLWLTSFVIWVNIFEHLLNCNLCNWSDLIACVNSQHGRCSTSDNGVTGWGSVIGMQSWEDTTLGLKGMPGITGS